LGHRGGISSSQWDYTADYGVTASSDRTSKLWDVHTGLCTETLCGHWDEVLEVCFYSAGSRLDTASADGAARVYAVMTGACALILTGHEGEMPRSCFYPRLELPQVTGPVGGDRLRLESACNF